MASLLERAYLPAGGVGLTAGVNYFGDVGQRQATSLLRPPQNVSPAAPTLPAAEVTPADAGWRVNPPEAGFGSGYDGTMDGSGVTGTPQGAVDAFGLTGQAAQALGLVAQDPGMVQFGGMLSQGASLANAVVNPSVDTFAPIAVNQLGLPAPAAGAVMGGINDGARGAVSGAVQGLAFTNPVTAAYSLAAPFVGLPTPGQMASSAITAANYGTDFMSPQTNALAAQDAGMYGIGAQTTNVSSTPADPTAVAYGTNFGSQQTSMLSAQENSTSAADFGGYAPDAPGQEGFDGSPATNSGGGGGGGGDGGGCCFIMLEARYGDGTMDSVVRKYRDEMLTDRNRAGYYKLAHVLVPLMRASRVFKFLVQTTFADPLVSYGKWYYKQNKHGWLFAPVKTAWMKVFDVLGTDTEFIEEKPAQFDKGAR